MRIILVEDDHNQVQWIEEALSKYLQDARVETIGTEHEFRSRFDGIAIKIPDIILIDIMLPWTDPAPEMPQPPDDVIADGYYTAGIRCMRMLVEREETSRLPVILYTVLEESDLKRKLLTLPDMVAYLQKTADPIPLIRMIRRLTGH